MTRTMSRKLDDGTVVHFAGAPRGVSMSDEEIRERCRFAPPCIRRSIDAERERHGMRRLWACDGKSSSVTPAKPRGGLPDRVMLVGVVAPGVSSCRVRVATDGERLRERIPPDAYRHFLRGVAEGSSVVRLTDGHGGLTLADTKAKTLQLAVDDVAGLVVQAVVPVMSLHRDVLAGAFRGEAGLSIGLRPVRVEMKRERGERVRIVRECSVDHVAVIRPHQGKPCYRTRVFAAFVNDQQGMKDARARAVLYALEGMRDQQRGG